MHPFNEERLLNRCFYNYDVGSGSDEEKFFNYFRVSLKFLVSCLPELVMFWNEKKLESESLPKLPFFYFYFDIYSSDLIFYRKSRFLTSSINNSISISSMM